MQYRIGHRDHPIVGIEDYQHHAKSRVTSGEFDNELIPSSDGLSLRTLEDFGRGDGTPLGSGVGGKISEERVPRCTRGTGRFASRGNHLGHR
jgi:hypothetical protein